MRLREESPDLTVAWAPDRRVGAPLVLVGASVSDCVGGLSRLYGERLTLGKYEYFKTPLLYVVPPRVKKGAIVRGDVRGPARK